MVNNVETLYNVHLAEQGAPVTRKFLSVCGAVNEPKSFWAPVGTPFRDLLALAGGATVAEFGVFVSGIMMGTLTFDLDDVADQDHRRPDRSSARPLPHHPPHAAAC